MSSHIRIASDITDWGWYRDANTFRVFFHLLAKANWKDGEYMGQTIRRGQVVIGLKKLAETLSISVRNVRTSINRLKSTREVTLKTTHRFTIVTICKYEYWRGGEEESDTPNDTPSDTQVTRKRHASDTQVTTSVDIKMDRWIDDKYNRDNISLAESALRRDGDDFPANADEHAEGQKGVSEDERERYEAEVARLKEELAKATHTTTVYTEEFDEDFKLYHRKGNKKRAFLRWQKLTEDDKVRMRRHIPVYWQSNEPQYLKDFEGYINQRVFESVVYDKKSGKIIFDPDKSAHGGYAPTGMYVLPQDDGTFLYFSDFSGTAYDGYDDDTRPDGAALVLNNDRGTITWSREERKWRIER